MKKMKKQAYDSSINISTETETDLKKTKSEEKSEISHKDYTKNRLIKLYTQSEEGNPNSQYEYGIYLLQNDNKKFLEGLKYIFKSEDSGNSKAEEFLNLNINNLYETFKDKLSKIEPYIKFCIGKVLLLNNNYISSIEILEDTNKVGYYISECYLVLYKYQIHPRLLFNSIYNLLICENIEHEKSIFEKESLYNNYLKEKDITIILSTLVKLADEYSSIKFLLGLFYISTKNLDLYKGFEYIHEAADYEYAPAQYIIGILFLEGKYNYNKNYRLSFYYMKRSAEQGYGQAEFKLAKYYNSGIGTKVNEVDAFNWMKRAALESQIDKAYLQLGLYYKCGVGTVQNMKLARKYLIKLTEQRKDPEAFYVIGVMFFEGDGFEKDRKKAFRCFQKGSKLNHGPSQYLLAECYFYGEGCELNYKQAFLYYSQASKNDHIQASFKLSLCLIEGNGCERDFKKGVEIINKIVDKLTKEQVSYLLETYQIILDNINSVHS